MAFTFVSQLFVKNSIPEPAVEIYLPLRYCPLIAEGENPENI